MLAVPPPDSCQRKETSRGHWTIKTNPRTAEFTFSTLPRVPRMTLDVNIQAKDSIFRAKDNGCSNATGTSGVTTIAHTAHTSEVTTIAHQGEEERAGTGKPARKVESVVVREKNAEPESAEAPVVTPRAWKRRRVELKSSSEGDDAFGPPCRGRSRYDQRSRVVASRNRRRVALDQQRVANEELRRVAVRTRRC